MKRTISMVMVMVIALSTICVFSAHAADAPSFWARNEITKAIHVGIITEKIQQDYQKDITREEFCELVIKLYEIITHSSAELLAENPFKDTRSPEILKAYKLGIVNGISVDEFSPERNITRQEICVMLVRCIDKAVFGAKINEYKDNTFVDGDEISDWAKPAVNYVYDNGIMTGKENNKIAPLDYTTCEQAIVLANRIFEKERAFALIDEDAPILLYGIKLGDSTEHVRKVLGAPGSVLASHIENVECHIYNQDYSNFIQVGIDIKNQTVATLLTFSKNWDIGGVIKFNADAETSIAYLNKNTTYRGELARNAFKGKTSDLYLLQDNHNNYRIDGIRLEKNDLVPDYMRTQPLNRDDLEMQMFHITNALRVRNDLPPYFYDEKLAKAARLHSEDMRERNYFDHISPDGRTLYDRAKEQGADYSSGEIITHGSSTPLSAIYAWLDSFSGHRAQIYSTSHTRVGFGYYDHLSTGLFGRQYNERKEMYSYQTPEVTGVSFSKVYAYPGDTLQGRASIGQGESGSREVLWSSGNESVLRVDDKGLVTAVAPGATYIKAVTKEGSKPAYCFLVVFEDKKLSSFSVENKSMTVRNRDQGLVAVHYARIKVEPFGADPSRFVCSSDSSAVNVYSNLVQPSLLSASEYELPFHTKEQSGSGVITVTHPDLPGFSQEIHVTVIDPDDPRESDTSYSLSRNVSNFVAHTVFTVPEPIVVKVGELFTITRPSGESAFSYSERTVEDINLVAMDPNGLACGTKPGRTVIRIFSRPRQGDNWGENYQEIPITVQ